MHFCYVVDMSLDLSILNQHNNHKTTPPHVSIMKTCVHAQKFKSFTDHPKRTIVIIIISLPMPLSYQYDAYA